MDAEMRNDPPDCVGPQQPSSTLGHRIYDTHKDSNSEK